MLPLGLLEDDESSLSLEDFLIILSFIFAKVVSLFAPPLSELRAEELEVKIKILSVNEN